MKQTKFKKVVKWENEEFLIIPLATMILVILARHIYYRLYFFYGIILPIAFILIYIFKVKRKVYWVKDR